MSRRLKIIFTLSVLLNVLLIGVVAGSCYKRMDGPRHFAYGSDPQFNHKMAKAMMEARKGQESFFKDMKDAKKELVEVLAAPDFSEEAFLAASAKVEQAQQALFKARNDATLKMAQEMTPEERQQMAKHMQAMSERHGRKGGFRDRDGSRGDQPPPPAN